MHPMVDYIRRELAKAENPDKARQMQAYMKTNQEFYGVQAVARRKIFKTAVTKFELTSRQEYKQVIFELWNGRCREEMYQALEVAEHYQIYQDEKSWPIYENLIKTSPNWDTLDWVAGKIVNRLVAGNRKLEAKLVDWSKSDNFWVRRCSLLAHLHHRKETNTRLLSETILKLAYEKEFFIRKAIGWILRDYSYANPDWVTAFVERHRQVLSGLSKREALKHINRTDG